MDNRSAELETRIEKVCRNAKASSEKLMSCSNRQRSEAILEISRALVLNKDKILYANKKDIDNISFDDSKKYMIDRLFLDGKKITSIAQGLIDIANQPDPIGKVLQDFSRPSGINIKSVSVPIGVLSIIYESRPNVTIDASILCLKSANSVILKGSSFAKNSNNAIIGIIQDTLVKTDIPKSCIQLLSLYERLATKILVKQTDTIDVVIPRGGKDLIKYLVKHSEVPLLKNMDGICHVYIHNNASLNKALSITLNSKMRRTSICNSTETILIDRSVKNSVLPELLNLLKQNGCRVKIEKELISTYNDHEVATFSDWSTEYLDSIVSIKLVNDVHDAIDHINFFGSHHTDCIITENNNIAQIFLNGVHSAVVMHNTSTQFSDGGEFGMGAEIGISTGKLHARGPIGINQLTTFKYKVVSNGSIRSI